MSKQTHKPNVAAAREVADKDAAARETAARARQDSEATGDKKAEAEKHPAAPFKPARDALNKLDDEIRKMRDADREDWVMSEMRRLRDEANGVVRRLEEMVTGD